MINWAKPVLIGGTHEQFKLAGTLNGKQLVVTTNSVGAQTLFVVDDDGSSFILNMASPATPPRGPKFENEMVRVEPFFMNVYADGTTGFRYQTSKEALEKGREASADVGFLGIAKITLAVDGSNGRVIGHVEQA